MLNNRVCRLYSQKELWVEDVKKRSFGATEVLVEVARGGICGSDLHYYQESGLGPIRVQEPIILGHEISGVIVNIGDSVVALTVGDKVAVNPS
jgi:L-idonate 5-dehydrogenase